MRRGVSHRRPTKMPNRILYQIQLRSTHLGIVGHMHRSSQVLSTRQVYSIFNIFFLNSTKIYWTIALGTYSETIFETHFKCRYRFRLPLRSMPYLELHNLNRLGFESQIIGSSPNLT